MQGVVSGRPSGELCRPGVGRPSVELCRLGEGVFERSIVLLGWASVVGVRQAVYVSLGGVFRGVWGLWAFNSLARVGVRQARGRPSGDLCRLGEGVF